jgi:hypothetical protein
MPRTIRAPLCCSGLANDWALSVVSSLHSPYTASSLLVLKRQRLARPRAFNQGSFSLSVPLHITKSCPRYFALLLVVMAVSKDFQLDNDDLCKSGAEHIDKALPPPTEDELSTWQCIRQNPKICVWILWANSKTPSTSPLNKELIRM